MAQLKTGTTIGGRDVMLEIDNLDADYADLKTDYEKEATEFTIESDDTYTRTDCKYYKKNGWVYLKFDVARVDGQAFARGDILLTMPVGFRPKEDTDRIEFPCLAYTPSADPQIKLMGLMMYETGNLNVLNNNTDKQAMGTVTYYAGGGTV